MRIFEAGDELGGVAQVTTVEPAQDDRHEAGINLVSKRVTQLRTSADGALLPVRLLSSGLQIPAYLTPSAVPREN